MTTFRVRVARHLRTMRRRAGLRQEELADRIGCCVRTIQRAEAGTGLPGDETICAWEEVCGAQLLPDSPHSPPV